MSCEEVELRTIVDVHSFEKGLQDHGVSSADISDFIAVVATGEISREVHPSGVNVFTTRVDFLEIGYKSNKTINFFNLLANKLKISQGAFVVQENNPQSGGCELIISMK